MAHLQGTLPTALSLLLPLASTACSSGDSSPPLVTQTGTTVEYNPCGNNTPVAGATVTIGSRTAVTASDGTYSIQVPSGTPFTMTVSAPTYIPLIEANDTVTASYDRGNTLLISSETAEFLEASLPNYESSAALLTIELVKTGSCTDVGGTTVGVVPSNASAVVQYPAQCASPVGATSATDGDFPSASGAVIYNLTPGTYTVTASSPKCTQVPYPYTDPSNGVTYDGNVTTQGGGANSFTRVFLK
ncbi:MAG: hypothetical protein ACLQVI_31465 [Polyangiaceae bacterium]